MACSKRLVFHKQLTKSMHSIHRATPATADIDTAATKPEFNSGNGMDVACNSAVLNNLTSIIYQNENTNE